MNQEYGKNVDLSLNIINIIISPGEAISLQGCRASGKITERKVFYKSGNFGKLIHIREATWNFVITI